MRTVLIVILFCTVVLAQPAVPDLKSWITDETGTLNSGELNTINSRLKEYEDTTSTQLVVLMISTLDDYPIEEYSLAVAEKNKIGTEKNDNGILLLIVKNDRKLRIEVGYGLEGAIPDALCSSIIRNEIIPHFRENDYYKGINAGIESIIKAAAGEYKQEKKDKETKPVSGVFSFMFIIFLIIMFFLRGGRRKGIVFLPGGFGGRGGFGGFGGGGGGFGGFSGGGGGFGGGGASGSW